jgi:hypothetical protein
MDDVDSRTDPLREWNHHARQNTENAIVSSMFEAGIVASEPTDSFSTWLLLGAAAIGGFLVSNTDKVLPLLTSRGLLLCGVLIVTSCTFGLVAKVLALCMKVMREVHHRVQTTFAEHLARYEEEESRIQAGAKFWGITLQTGIRMDRVLEEFYKPLPFWVGWLGRRHVKRHKDNPQIAYLPLVKTLTAQSLFTLAQALAFIGFLGAAFIHAAAAEPVAVPDVRQPAPPSGARG